MKKAAKKAVKKTAAKKGGRRMCAEGGKIDFGSGFLGRKPLDDTDQSAIKRKKDSGL